MQTLLRSSLLPLSPEKAWALLKQTETLGFVTEPYVTYHPVEKLGTEWSSGMVVDIKPCAHLFNCSWGLGSHKVFISRLDPLEKVIETQESGRLIRIWNHAMRIEPGPTDTSCQYVDEVKIDAGRLTWLIYLFACRFYRYRHLRWHELAEDISKT